MTFRPDLPGAPDRSTVPGAPGDVAEPTGAPSPAGSATQVRPARPEDVAEILDMVRELAAYEKAAHEVRATEQDLTELLFADAGHERAPGAFCHVAPDPAASADSGAQLAGFALWFRNTSTWTGRHGIYLEDLYVRPHLRSAGFGSTLMAQLAHICVQRGYTRLEWSVLDWNTPALDFYRTLGARAMDDWTVHRLTDEALAALAAKARAS